MEQKKTEKEAKDDEKKLLEERRHEKDDVKGKPTVQPSTEAHVDQANPIKPPAKHTSGTKPKTKTELREEQRKKRRLQLADPKSKAKVVFAVLRRVRLLPLMHSLKQCHTFQAGGSVRQSVPILFTRTWRCAYYTSAFNLVYALSMLANNMCSYHYRHPRRCQMKHQAQWRQRSRSRSHHDVRKRRTLRRPIRRIVSKQSLGKPCL